MTKTKNKPRVRHEPTLKSHLRQRSIRLTKADKKRLWISTADLAVENFRRTHAQSQKLMGKLTRVLSELAIYSNDVLGFAVKGDPSCFHDGNGK